MTTNETLTLTLSSSALLVSVASATFGFWLQRREMRTTVRQQLTDIVQHMIATQEAMNALTAGKDGPESAESLQRAGSLNHRLTSLARQATELDRLEPTVAFDVEYIAIANALWSSGNSAAAEPYFKKSINEAKRTKSPFYEAINTRLFARFLHRHGQ